MKMIPKTIFSSSFLHAPHLIKFKKISNRYNKFLNKTPNTIPNQTPDNAKIEKSSEEEGIDEAIKNRSMNAEKNRQAVDDMVANSNRILLRISSVFPFDIFPNHITIEETRLTIVYRQFLTAQVRSIDIKNISNVFVNTGIFFAQLTIVSNTFAENEIVIHKLWKKEAIFARRITEGLRMFVNKNIDTTGYEIEELLSKLKELSTTKIGL